MDQDAKPARGKGRGRGRGRKKVADQEKSVEETNSLNADTKSNEPESIALDLDADITHLEAPTFSTINKGPPEPMLRLNWDHKTHLIGEKVINPMIHCCDKCEAPILIYGRMIPCRHVFCLTCAEIEAKIICPRCQEKVIRIEKTGLGTVFMCTFGGSRYGNTGCRRTYLSQRDLLAHINHRHVAGTNKESSSHNQTTPLSKSTPIPTVSLRSKATVPHHAAVAGDPRVHTNSNHDYFYKSHSSTHVSQPSHRQSHHHSTHNERHPVQSNSHSSHSQQQPNQSSQPIFPPVNQILVPNFPPPSHNPLTIPPIRSNLITIQTHDSNSDSHMGLMAPSFQAFSSSFPPPGGIPFPVPPPSQSAMNALSQTASQFYSNTPINYSLTSSQRLPVSQFCPNSPGQLLHQSPNQPTPQMVPPPGRNQFSREGVMQQQLAGTQNHRWQNQSQFF